jgi:hypothetical protein
MVNVKKVIPQDSRQTVLGCGLKLEVLKHHHLQNWLASIAHLLTFEEFLGVGEALKVEHIRKSVTNLRKFIPFTAYF